MEIGEMMVKECFPQIIGPLIRPFQQNKINQNIANSLTHVPEVESLTLGATAPLPPATAAE